jgi:hypothetical protein
MVFLSKADAQSQASAGLASFQDDEATMVKGLPKVERVATGPYKGALVYSNPGDKTPWYLSSGKGWVKLLSNPVVWDDTRDSFSYERAVAVVTRNVCGIALQLHRSLDRGVSKGRLGGCNYVDEPVTDELRTGVSYSLVLTPTTSGVGSSSRVEDVQDDDLSTDDGFLIVPFHPRPGSMSKTPNRSAFPAAELSSSPSGVPMRTQFRTDESAVLKGLPLLQRVTQRPDRRSLLFNHLDARDPWNVAIEKDRIRLWSSTKRVDDQNLFTFDLAVATVSKNVCGEGLDLVKSAKIGRVGVCRYVRIYEGERTTTTVVLTAANRKE